MGFLKGKYYHCIFDHDAGVYDTSKPHFHKITDAEWIDAPGDARNGLRLYLDIYKWSQVYSGPVYVGGGERGFDYIYEKAGDKFEKFYYRGSAGERK